MDLGLQIIPTMPVQEVIETALLAEELGYSVCLLADEGFMPDVYVAAGALAQRTQRLQIGVVTNGYTRHPAVTANALATLHDLSDGRAVVCLVAGGSMVLNPMGIAREAPLAVMADTIAILRALWSGENATFQGKRYALSGAALHGGQRTIPIWLAVRGEKMLELAARTADGIVLMAKSDLGPALAVMQAADPIHTATMRRAYLDRIAYTPAMLEEAGALYTYALLDSPQRMLDGMGVAPDEIATIRAAMQAGGPPEAAKHVRPDMIRRYQIAGTPEECTASLRDTLRTHALDLFIMNITSPGLSANRRLLEDVATMAKG
ncbi:MAG: LLM class flavin-dependent oxidoreductase [Caldilineaceae bacterium]